MLWLSTEKMLNPEGFVSTLTQHETLVTYNLRCKYSLCSIMELEHYEFMVAKFCVCWIWGARDYIDLFWIFIFICAVVQHGRAATSIASKPQGYRGLLNWCWESRWKPWVHFIVFWGTSLQSPFWCFLLDLINLNFNSYSNLTLEATCEDRKHWHSIMLI